MSIGTPSVLAQGLIDYGGGSTPSVTPQAASLLLLFIEEWPDPNTALTVSGQADGDGWSVVSDDFVTDQARHIVLAAKSPASPAAGAITVTPPGGLRCHYYLVEIVLSGGAWSAATVLEQSAFGDGFGTAMGAALLSATNFTTLSFTSWSADNTGTTYENAQLGSVIEVSASTYYIGMDYASAGDQTPTINRGSSATWTSTTVEISDPAVAAGDSTAPTFSVAPAVGSITDTGGTVTATIDETGDIYYVVVADGATAPTPAEVIAGQESGGGSPLASGNATNITSINDAFTGLSASSAYDLYIVARDDEGTPNVQASVTKVDFTTTAPQFGITSITSAPIYASDTVTISLANASATGKTLTIQGQAITPDSQNASQIVFTAPDPKTFGDNTLSYNNPLTVQVTDGGSSDTVDFQITPDIGHYYATIAEVAGIFADDTGVVVGDRAYGYWQSGSGAVSLAYGALSSPNGGTFRYWIQDDTDGAWGSSADEVFVDSVNPIITLTGGSTVNINEGDAWSDPGYSASDNVDGDLTGSVVVAGDTVDPNTIGTYVVTYNVTDAAGNAAQQVTRTVNVLDVTAPVITLLGTTPVTHPHGQTYVDAGYTATDNHDGDLSGSVVLTGNVNSNVVGQYTLTYNLTDAAGNAAATRYRTVNVTDQAGPTITLLGANPLSVDIGATFTDPGYTATDAVDGDLTSSVVVSGSVNVNVAGSYNLSYNVEDAAGNFAPEVVRTVNVVTDAAAPVITLTGGAVTLDVGDTFTEPGYTATDNVDGDITDQVAVTGTVDTATAGLYVLQYDVTDSSGNPAAQRNRLVTVNAVVVTPPEDASESWKTQLIQPYATYVDPILEGVLDSQDTDVASTAVWTGQAVDTTQPLTAKVEITTMSGTIENAALGQVSFTPDGSIPSGQLQYTATARDGSGNLVTFATGKYTVNSNG